MTFKYYIIIWVGSLKDYIGFQGGGGGSWRGQKRITEFFNVPLALYSSGTYFHYIRYQENTLSKALEKKVMILS